MSVLLVAWNRAVSADVMPSAAVQQAGAITVRPRGGAHEVLLVRAKKNPEHWVFPKGHIEAGESGPVAAARELLEEGGVHGRPDHVAGVSDYVLGDRHIHVTYYLVWYEGDGQPHEERERVWLPVAAARDRLSFEDMRRCLDVVAAQLPPAR